MKLEHTFLQKIELGDSPADTYYCLIDRRISPDGLSLEKMRLTDPRNIDREFRKNGCLMMFTGEEIRELVQREELEADHLHSSLYRLAEREGSLRQE